MSADAPLRQPIPLARSILWSPASAGPPGGAGGAGGAGGTGGRPGHIAFPAFLAQSALQAIHEHLAAPPKPGQGLLGFLVGDLCECPDTNVFYLVIDSVLRLNQPIYGDRTMDVVTRIWDRIEAQAAEQQGHLIGWYHTHPPLPIALSEHDLETHEHYFAEPWQIALIVGTTAAGTEPAGGVFRAGSDEAWPTTQLPFYELFGEESTRAGGKNRSLIAWKNYRAYDPLADRAQVVPEGETVRAPTLAPPPPAPESPVRRDVTPPLASPKPPAPAKSNELVFLTTADDFASTPPAAPARTPLPEPPRAPPRRTPPPVPPAPPPRRPAPAAPQPLPEEPAEEFVAEPVAESFEESVAEVQPRVVRAPPARLRRSRKKRRGVWVTAFGILLVGAGAGLYFQFKPSLPSVPSLASLPKQLKLPKLPKLPSLPWPKRQATTPPGSRAPATGAAPRAAAPFARLDQVGGSLAQAVRTFGERAALFDLGQLGCDGLARALQTVEDRWAVYSAARRAAGVLDPQHAAWDQTLYAGVDSAERRFERSGCRRP